MYDTGQVVPPAKFKAWIETERALYAPIAPFLPQYATSYLPEPIHRAG
jgi:hypothetical protein